MAATYSPPTLGMHPPLADCFRHGLRTFFFSLSRTVSYDRLSTTPNSTIWSASPPEADKVQWSWPSGASLHARAIRWSSPFSSSLRKRLA